MKYQIAGKKAREALSALPNFPDAFREACQARRRDGEDLTVYVPGGFTIQISCDQIEKLEYDPNGWNRFPDIEPPANLLMRCIDGGRPYVAFYTTDRRWLDADTRLPCAAPMRYRPWDD